MTACVALIFCGCAKFRADARTFYDAEQKMKWLIEHEIVGKAEIAAARFCQLNRQACMAALKESFAIRDAHPEVNTESTLLSELTNGQVRLRRAIRRPIIWLGLLAIIIAAVVCALSGRVVRFKLAYSLALSGSALAFCIIAFACVSKWTKGSLQRIQALLSSPTATIGQTNPSAALERCLNQLFDYIERGPVWVGPTNAQEPRIALEPAKPIATPIDSASRDLPLNPKDAGE